MEDTQTNEQDVETPAEEAMREPFAKDISEYLERIRRNLLIFGFIALAYKLSGAQLHTDSTIFGFHLVNIDPRMLEVGLLVLLGYHLLHFAWAAWEEADKWRLRFSGLSGLYPRGTSFDPQLNEREEIFHVTLYNWWLYEMKHVQRKLDWFTSTKERLAELEESIEQCSQHGGEKNANEVSGKLRNLQSTLTELNIPYDPLLVHWEEIKAPLDKFDKCFWRQQTSWYWRWVVIEAGLPLFVGGVGAGFLVHGIWFE